MRSIDLEKVHLEKGAHKQDSVYCVMELAAYIAEEPWSDHPLCVSPVIASFLRNWNDALDDHARQALKPYALKSLNTMGTAEQENQRVYLAIDWLIREYAPALLQIAGLTEHADKLKNLAPVINKKEAQQCQLIIAAAWDAARAAAGDAARAAAWAAARAAAWAAAGKKLELTVKTLQQSAFLLLDRMIAVSSKTAQSRRRFSNA